MYEYKAVVERVLDADTFSLNLDLGFHISIRHNVRLLGIDAYETKLIRGATVEEVVIGKTGKEWVKKWLIGKEVTVTTKKDSTDKYGRYLCEMWIVENEENIFVNSKILEMGFAKKMEM